MIHPFTGSHVCFSFSSLHNCIHSIIYGGITKHVFRGLVPNPSWTEYVWPLLSTRLLFQKLPHSLPFFLTEYITYLQSIVYFIKLSYIIVFPSFIFLYLIETNNKTLYLQINVISKLVCNFFACSVVIYRK